MQVGRNYLEMWDGIRPAGAKGMKKKEKNRCRGHFVPMLKSQGKTGNRFWLGSGKVLSEGFGVWACHGEWCHLRNIQGSLIKVIFNLFPKAVLENSFCNKVGNPLFFFIDIELTSLRLA